MHSASIMQSFNVLKQVVNVESLGSEDLMNSKFLPGDLT
jgi:hypothetical protein